jgi:hypothetical protein
LKIFRTPGRGRRAVPCPGLPGGAFSPAPICLNGSVRTGLLPRLTGHRICRDSAEARSTRRIIDLPLPPVMHAKNKRQRHRDPALAESQPPHHCCWGARAAPIRRAVSQRNANEPLKLGLKGMASSLARRHCSRLHACVLRNCTEIESQGKFALA